ncbi:MAG TPA: inositol monophosphatase family protein, partial [Gemmatimonadaceae bacterium]
MNAPKLMQADTAARGAELLPMMIAAADSAAAYIIQRTADRGTLEWRAKAHQDFVSDVDTGAERVVRESLLAGAPDAGILGEELSPNARADAEMLFVVDPLDGTTNFLHGFPHYAVSIALVLNGTPAAGVVRNVVSGESFTAVLQQGARLNGARISVSTIHDPALSLVGTGIPFRTLDQLPVYLRQLDAIARATSGVRRAGSAALDLCDVACGRFEGFWELYLSPWDFAAGALIIREAGGIATTVDGEPLPLSSSSVLAGTPAIHAWIGDLFRKNGGTTTSFSDAT